MLGKTTGYVDKHGNKIREGDELKGKTIDGDTAIFKVRWSDFHKNYIGDNPDEIYDVSHSIFHQYEIVD